MPPTIGNHAPELPQDRIDSLFYEIADRNPDVAAAGQEVIKAFGSADEAEPGRTAIADAAIQDANRFGEEVPSAPNPPEILTPRELAALLGALVLSLREAAKNPNPNLEK